MQYYLAIFFLTLINVISIEQNRFAKLDEFPWQTAIFDRSTARFLCSGALIAKQWVITINECVFYKHIVDIDTYFRLLNKETKEFNVSSKVLNKFHINDVARDVTLLELDREIHELPHVYAISLVNENDDTDDYLFARASGWEYVDNSSLSNTLSWQMFLRNDHPKCSKFFKKNRLNPNRYYCLLIAPESTKFKSSIGSPLVVYTKDKTYQLFGLYSGWSSHPAYLFTRIPRDYIRQLAKLA